MADVVLFDLKRFGWTLPVRCKECKFNYGLSSGNGFSPEDIVCSYWESDGLTEDDFCSQGEPFVQERKRNNETY